MRHISLAIAALALFGVCSSFAEENRKTFTYSKTKQADLEIAIDFPPDWKATDKRPGIVFFFGGGWQNGNIKAFERQAKYLATRGMVAARADYRVGSRQGTTPKEAVDDARSALSWFRENAATLGVDPERLVASGGSAGGHIAACTTLKPQATSEDSKTPSHANSLVLFNPVLQFGPELLKRIDGDEELGKAISPLAHVTASTPPTLLFFGTSDRLLEQGQKFVRAAEEVGTKAEIFVAPDQGHGFFHKSPWFEKTLYRTDEFLISLGYLEGQPTVTIPDEPTR